MRPRQFASQMSRLIPFTLIQPRVTSPPHTFGLHCAMSRLGSIAWQPPEDTFLFAFFLPHCACHWGRPPSQPNAGPKPDCSTLHLLATHPPQTHPHPSPTTSSMCRVSPAHPTEALTCAPCHCATHCLWQVTACGKSSQAVGIAPLGSKVCAPCHVGTAACTCVHLLRPCLSEPPSAVLQEVWARSMQDVCDV